MNSKKKPMIFKLFLGLVLLGLSACSQITTLRTKEIQSVETNLSQRIDSLEMKLDSMREENLAHQRRLQADLGSLIGAQENGINRMVSLLEEMGYTVEKVAVNTNQIKNTRVKVEHFIHGADSNSQADMKVTSMAEIEVEKLFATAQQDFSASRFQEAYKTFKQIYTLNPKGRRAEEALYWMAVCYESTQKVDWAKQVYERLLSEFPEGNKVCTTQFHLSRIAATKSDIEGQKAHLNIILSDPKCKGSNEFLRAQSELENLK